MKKDMHIVVAIKNGDEKRENFFINKLKEDLKKYSLNYTEDNLREIMRSCIENYNEGITVNFYTYLFGQCKKKLQENVLEKNDFFTEFEMLILKDYFGIGTNNCLAVEDICKSKKISLFELNLLINKFKTLLKERKDEILKIYPDAVSFVKNRALVDGKTKKLQIRDLTDREMELIGYYTGAIGNRKLSLSELADERNISNGQMKKTMKYLITLIDKKDNFEKILEKYPKIIYEIPIRAKELNIETPRKIEEYKEQMDKRSNYISDTNFLKTVYKRKNDGSFMSTKELASYFYCTVLTFKQKYEKVLEKVENNKEFLEALLNYYPDFYKDKKAYEEYASSNAKQKEVEKEREKEEVVVEEKSEDKIQRFEKNIEILKIILTKNNGRFLPMKDIINRFQISDSYYYFKRKTIFKELEVDEEFKNYLLEKYPDLFKDVVNYKKEYMSPKSITDNYESYLQIVKLLFTKKDGKYLSNGEIAEELGQRKSVIGKKISNIFYILDNDSEFAKYVRENYENFDEERNAYHQEMANGSEKRDSILTKEKKYKNYLKVLKVIFRQDINGKVISNLNASLELGLSYKEFMAKKSTIIHFLKRNEEFQKYLDDNYPEWQENFQQYLEQRTNKKVDYDESYENCCLILKTIFKRNSDLEYLSNEEISKKIKVNSNLVANVKNSLLYKIKNDEEFRKYLSINYPEYEEDIKLYNAKIYERKTLKSYNNQEALLRILLEKKDNEFEGLEEKAKVLQITKKSLQRKKGKLFKKIESDEEFRHYLERHYPTYQEELEEYIKEEEKRAENDKLEKAWKNYEEQALFLKAYYSKDEQGNYKSEEEIGKEFKISVRNINRKKDRCLELIKKDANFGLYLDDVYPTFLEDKEEYDHKFSSNNIKMEHNILFLKTLLEKNEKNEFKTIEEVATQLGLTVGTVYRKRNVLMNEARENEEFLKYIQNSYPTFLEDKEEYDKVFFRGNDSSSYGAKQISNSEWLELLQLVIQPKEDGQYNNNAEIAEKLKISNMAVLERIKKLRKKLEDDDNLKKYLITNYDGYLVDLEKYETDKLREQEAKEKEKKLEKYRQSSLFLQELLKRNDKGKYCNTTEVAGNLELTYNQVMKRKYKLFALLDTDSQFRDYLETKTSLDMGEVDNYRLYNSKDYNFDDYEGYVIFLKVLLEKEQGEYRKTKEVAEELGLTLNYFYIKRKKIFEDIKSNADVREFLDVYYPTYQEDIQHYINRREEQLEKDVENKKNVFEIYSEFFQVMVKPLENGIYYTDEELADIFMIKTEAIRKRRKKVESLILENKEFRTYLSNNYPNYEEDLETYENNRQRRIAANRKKVSSNFDSYLEFIKVVLTKKDDGTYWNAEELANKYNITISSVNRRKRIIFDLAINNEQFKKYLESNFSEYKQLKAEYDINYKDSIKVKTNSNTSHFDELLDFLKMVLSKNANGEFKSTSELASILAVNPKNIINRRYYVFKKLESDEAFRDFILRNYPTVFKDKLAYEEQLNLTSNCRSDSLKLRAKYENMIKLLEVICSKNKYGKYLTDKELSEIVKIPTKNLCERKRKCLLKFEEDEEFRKYLFSNCPKLAMEIDKYKVFMDKIHSQGKAYTLKTTQYENNVELLKLFFSKYKEKYLAYEEIAYNLGLSVKTIQNKMRIICKLFMSDEEFEEFLRLNYPDIFKELSNYMEHKEEYVHSEELSEDVVLEIINLLKIYYKENTDGSYKSITEIDEELGINSQDKLLTIRKLMQKNKKLEETILNNYSDLYNDIALREERDGQLREEITKDTYRSDVQDSVIRDNFSASRSILVSSKELKGIKESLDNDEDFDDSIQKGLLELDNSKYGDFSKLCNFKQRIILALRLGFYNKKIFNCQEISTLVNIDCHTINLLVDSCLQFSTLSNEEKQKVKMMATN